MYWTCYVTNSQDCDSKGNAKQEKKAKKWVSPQMKKILQGSGKDFTHVISDSELDDLQS